jgi:small subunit ribosomal protein S18
MQMGVKDQMNSRGGRDSRSSSSSRGSSSRGSSRDGREGKAPFRKGGSAKEGRFPREFPMRKRVCRFCRDKVKDIDYKDLDILQRFITEKGRILTSRISGNCAKHQRKMAESIKRARFIALLPFVKEGKYERSYSRERY